MSLTSPFRPSRGEDRPAAQTWIADRINALVWRLPAPRRVKVLLSQLAYRNPPIPPERVVETLLALDQAGIAIVVIGGWGIDALVGRQLRSHSDLDLITDRRDLAGAGEVLRKLGFEPWNDDRSPGPIGRVSIIAAQTFRDSALRVVELHAADLGEVESARGTIGGNRVTCLSAGQQLQAQRQMGRTWTPQRRLTRKRNLTAVQGALKGDPNRA